MVNSTRLTLLLIINFLFIYLIHYFLIKKSFPDSFFELKLADLTSLAAQLFIAFIAFSIQKKLIFTNKLIDNIIEEINFFSTGFDNLESLVQRYNTQAEKENFHEITKLLKTLRSKEEQFFKRMKLLKLKSADTFNQKAVTEIFNIRNTITGDNFGKKDHEINLKHSSLVLERHQTTLQELKSEVFKIAYSSSIFS